MKLTSTSEETRVRDQYLRIFADYTCFSGEKVDKKIAAQVKCNFLIKSRVFAHWFHYFCREFADMMPPGGHFAPP